MNDKDTDRDDQAWFDLLAGRTSDQACPEARRDAEDLRAAILQRHDLPQAPEMDERARSERLVNRARAEGLLDPGRTCTDDRPRWWKGSFLPWWSRLGGAVALLVMFGTVWQLQRPVDPDEGRSAEVERGSGVQRLQADDPNALRERLMADLRAAGAEVQPYERLTRLGIDVDLPQPVPQALTDVATRYGLHMDADLGVLMVEIEQTSGAAGGSK